MGHSVSGFPEGKGPNVSSLYVSVSMCFRISVIVPDSAFAGLCFPVPYDALVAGKELNLHLSTHKGFN